MQRCALPLRKAESILEYVDMFGGSVEKFVGVREAGDTGPYRMISKGSEIYEHALALGCKGYASVDDLLLDYACDEATWDLRHYAALRHYNII